MKTAYSGSFGNDDAGAFGIGSLTDQGVNIEFTKRVPTARTQIAFIVIDEATGERTVIWKRDADLAFSADEAPSQAVSEASILHMTPHDTEACIALAHAGRNAGTVVSLDIDNVFDGVEELLHSVDILLCSSEFPFRLTGIGEHRSALATISKEFKNSVCGVTLGEHGSLLFCNGEFIETPGFEVPGGCRDTTGAGDAFRTGFLFGVLNGETVESAAKMANAVAALKCRSVGARTALPSEIELTNFLRKS
jgi:sugar/nucleoside kinase (ribokinase family)